MNTIDTPVISYYPEGILHKKGAENKPAKYISFRELLQMHRSEQLRKAKERIKRYEYGSYMYRKLKSELPCVLFNKFEYNLNTGFLEENPIKPFDVDLSDNTPQEIERFKEAISREAVAVVESTSGVKFFLEITFGTSDPKEYLEMYKAVCDSIERRFNIRLDRAQGRIKQPYFISYNDKINLS